MLEGVSKEKPRLLVVASTFPAQRGDGTPELVGDLAAELVPKIDVRIIVPQVSGARSSEIYRGAKVSRFRYFPRRWEDLADGAVLENIRSKPSRLLLQVVPFLVCEWLAVRKAVKQFDPDIIHAHWIIPQGLVVRLASRRPILLTTLGGDLCALDRFPINKLMRWIIRGAAAVTVMNTDMKERVLGLGAAASDVQVIPMGANLTGMTSRVPSTNPAMVRLLFVGRLVPKKGLTFPLDALRQLPSGLQWKLIVVGDGPLRNELENDAQGLSVEFVGVQSRSELRRTYANSDILITPSVPADSGDQDGLGGHVGSHVCRTPSRRLAAARNRRSRGGWTQRYSRLSGRFSRDFSCPPPPHRVSGHQNPARKERKASCRCAFDGSDGTHLQESH